MGDHAALLQALSERVYAQVLEGIDDLADAKARIRALLTRYHQAVSRHPQLTMAIFDTPEAYAGITCQITQRLTSLLAQITPEPTLWCDILVDHAHGSSLALASARGDPAQLRALQHRQQQALDVLLSQFPKG